MTNRRPYGGVSRAEREATRRVQLFQSGYDLLADGGPSAVTVRAVCDRAGLTSRYFYEHFAGSEALIDEIVSVESEAIFAEVLSHALAANGGPRDVVSAGVSAMLDAVADDMRRGQLGRLGATDASMLRAREVLVERMIALTVQHVDSVWSDAPEDPTRIALACRLCVRGAIEMIIAWLDGRTDLTRRRLVNLAANYVIETGGLVFNA